MRQGEDHSLYCNVSSANPPLVHLKLIRPNNTSKNVEFKVIKICSTFQKKTLVHKIIWSNIYLKLLTIPPFYKGSLWYLVFRKSSYTGCEILNLIRFLYSMTISTSSIVLIIKVGVAHLTLHFCSFMRSCQNVIVLQW